MTKQDYVLIARIIKEVKDGAANTCQHELIRLAKELASELRATNPSFNREKFLAACGVYQ